MNALIFYCNFLFGEKMEMLSDQWPQILKFYIMTIRHPEIEKIYFPSSLKELKEKWCFFYIKID